MDTICLIALILYICYAQEQWLFYREMKKRCKRYRGNCDLCDCWSCPKKLYDDVSLIKKQLEK